MARRGTRGPRGGSAPLRSPRGSRGPPAPGRPREFSGTTALVTGAEGFIGGVLVPNLAAAGRRVVAAHLGPISRPPGWEESGVEAVRLDITDPGRVREVFTEAAPQEVYHLAAMSLPSRSWAEPWETLRVNVEGTVNVLEEARRLSSDPRVFVACSSAEYGDSLGSESGASEDSPLLPVHPYGVSKVTQDLLARQYFRNYGVRALRGRIFNTIGPRKTNDAPSDFASQIAQVEVGHARVVEVGNLETRRDFTDVRDMAEGIEIATTRGRPGETYNLCTGRATSLRTVLETLLSLATKPVPWEVRPDRLRPADEALILGNNRKISGELGWRPRVPLTDTLRSIYQYWHERALKG